ncbi:MAG TPA: acyl-CoA thioesterase [Chloroflexota bacterium]|nr:acyl-CoA thioesterase [Chloroflexota bacterium]
MSDQPPAGHSIAYSRSTTSRIMDVLDSNRQGNVHGGVIMRMVDEAAGVVALKHSQHQVVTARVDRFDFWKPAYLGDVVTIDCALEFVGRTSMEIAVTVTAEDPITREVRRVASSRVIYVAIDEHGRPTPVPPLVPADAQEQATVDQARARRAASEPP